MGSAVLCGALASADALGQVPTATARHSFAKKSWPAEVARVDMPMSDGATQAAMWHRPPEAGKKPLLVGLHTWSSTFASAGGDAIYAEWCVKQGWAFLHPDFRGPNHSPSAMGSDRAVQDVVEAVAWAKDHAEIDPERIYLIGGSGGAHMALLMAGRHPEIWAGVSAWCPITDIARWHQQHVKNGSPDKYARDIETVLGGVPAEDETRRAEAWKRSPLAWLGQARNVPLDINHGVHDGRLGSVPFTHALRAFNTVAREGDRLDEAALAAYYATRQLPTGWDGSAADAVYGAWTPLFRRVSGNVRITIFEGAHEVVHQAALNWLALQHKGKPAVWTVVDFVKLEVGGGETAK